MSLLFIHEDSAVIGVEEKRCVVKYKDGLKTSVPIETLESITIMGKAQMSSQCVHLCLKKGIPVCYFSKGGSYFGRLQSTGHVNVERQRRQCILYNSAFALDMAKQIMKAKLKNQLVVLRRYERSAQEKFRSDETVESQMRMIRICRGKIDACDNIPEIMGFEGQAAKAYFSGLAELIEPEFRFHGRSRRPPMDEFNSMISLGYAIIMNEIYARIENKGLNPYFGFVHRDREQHPTLVSDMMEEWRAVIVDATVMSMINGHEIQKEHFIRNYEEPGCYLTREGLKLFLPKLERKLQTKIRYLSYVDYAVSFRQGIDLQLGQLVKAIEAEDAGIYQPLEIR